MGSVWFDLANEYSKLLAKIYVTRHLGGNYKKDAKKAQEMLEELRRMHFPQMSWLEKRLVWALEAPAEVTSDDFMRGQS
jgi:hypothetical protein